MGNIPWIYPVRIVQVLFGVIVVALTAYVISALYDWWSFSDTVNYLLFLGCWTAFVATPYLAAAPIYFPAWRIAVTVFGAFEWVLFAVTTYFALVDVVQHRRSGESAQKTQHNAHLGV
ncbi:hypothetical protein N7462_000295 [Penicillium macrosclerotiorum]|uniref:uncharacterized protein n=1 Tax=Penicillium macrosclerotiorum TaxID=303699 RepID=UPI002547AD2E|nr:uncharacterized protein N7462_000295 [Penicillium macrosclerotiorum]KAJ5698290.1 hypothetical protein N7462_000295 [Penicillium macrosclerotiorum]